MSESKGPRAVVASKSLSGIAAMKTVRGESKDLAVGERAVVSLATSDRRISVSMCRRVRKKSSFKTQTPTHVSAIFRTE